MIRTPVTFPRLKAIGRTVAPGPVKTMWGRVYGELKIRRAREAFECAPNGPSFLSATDLRRLMRNGYRPPPPIRYDTAGLVERAAEKIGQLEMRVPLDRCRTSVELGCWDGMVLAVLAARRHVALGVDRSRDGFDARAAAAGAQLIQAEASRLPIDSRSVDLVYSFAAFEHFADTAAVVDESWRVLRAGGYFYLLFGPVYTSPYGLHAYRQIPVPYCHFLFTHADLTSYAQAEGLPVRWPYVNGVSVTEYRQLWAQQTDRFDAIYYHEHPSGGVGAELIARYPSCFRGKVPAFGDLLVSGIEICLHKR